MKTTRKNRNQARRIIRMTACVLIAFLMLFQTAFADSLGAETVIDPIHSGENYSAVIYDNTNGLPTSEANDIAQTSEGFIWIGSYGGLVRYDGNTFERMDSTGGISSVVSLLVDSRDRLWIGTNDNGLAMMESGEITTWDVEDGLCSTKARRLEEGADGSIYVGTTSGINIISPDMKLSHVDDPLVAEAYIEKMCLGSDGLIYCITSEDDFFTLEGDKLVNYVDHTETRIKGITCILPDPDDPDKIFIGTEGSDLYHGDLKKSIDSMDKYDISPLFNVLDIQKIGGNVWLCGNNGIGVADKEGFHYLDNLPMKNSVERVMADYEGNLWFASSRQGVMKIVPNRFRDLYEVYGLESEVVNSTCIYDDMLLIATDTGLRVLGENGPVEYLPLNEARTASGEYLASGNLIDMLSGFRIRSIISDSKGRLWFSTWRGCGLLCYDSSTSEAIAYTEDDGLLSNHVRAIAEAGDGSIYVAHTGGVAVIKDDKIVKTYGKDDGIANQEILTVTSSPEGDIVLGSNGEGVYVIDDQGLRNIGRKDGLTSGIIMRIKRDDKRKIYWLVTSNSLAYMDFDYNVHTISEFPYSNNFDIYENSEGDMWILSSYGIFVLPAEELLLNRDLNPVHYGISNGLPYMTPSNSYSALTPEGDLYMCGNSGVVKVNIDGSMEEIKDIKQAVPYLDVDGIKVYPDENGQFTIPSSALKVTVYPYVYDYSMTDPKVTYDLDGFDREPITVRCSELGPVTYTNLSGGDYTFTMELKDAMGRGSKKLSVSIVKEKSIFEKPWFYISLGLILLFATTLLVRNYVRWLVADMEEKHHKEEEDRRIADELLMASRIQTGMLPHDFPPFPDRKEFDIYASMDPAREVGGDFYDYYMIDEDHLCLVMADVSGKGIPASLMMMISKVLLKSFANGDHSAADILSRVNDMLSADNRMDMFVTAWLGILEISTGKLVAANAGHEYPVIRRSGRPYEIFKDKHGLVLGGMEGISYKEYELTLAPGDRLFLYTDGVPEATDADNNMFGMDRMVRALNIDPNAEPKQVLANVREAVDDFVKDAEQFDDLTMLCLEYSGPNGL